jgi:molecular chaperone GrpE
MSDEPQRHDGDAEGTVPEAEAAARRYEEVAEVGDVAPGDGTRPGPQDPGEETAGQEGAALEAARAEAERYKDLALRAQAEAENARRRAARDVENAHRYALEKFAAQLLPVVDSVEKSVEAADAEEGDERFAAVREGIQLTHRLFLDTLAKAGIEQVNPVGEPFDPERHEAMTMIEAPHAEPNSVVDVLQKGWVLNGRLLRAAMVVVARGPGG